MVIKRHVHLTSLHRKALNRTSTSLESLSLPIQTWTNHIRLNTVLEGIQRRWKSTNAELLSSLFVPVQVEPTINSGHGEDIGEEFTGKLNRDDVLKVMNAFYRRPEMKRLAEEHGRDSKS